ncbi:Uncharacterised protein [Mycobacteroides abscessus subsp. abscessus]|nr:Uncharacterised protein [Mycobacteroides abscessus subsp. abscessus]
MIATTAGDVRITCRNGQSRWRCTGRQAACIAIRNTSSTGCTVTNGAASAAPATTSTANGCDCHRTASATPHAATANATANPGTGCSQL